MLKVLVAVLIALAMVVFLRLGWFGCAVGLVFAVSAAQTVRQICADPQ